MTDPDPAIDLRTAGYHLRERWETRDVLGFVQRELGFSRWPLGVLWVSLGLQLLALGFVAVASIRAADGAWLGAGVWPIGIGLLAFVALVPPHELIHGSVYKLLGAKQISYGANWRQLVFHAAAPRFVLSAKTLMWVAMAPFLLVTPLLVGLAWMADPFWRLVAVAALISHTQGCIGDFCMVNFFWRRRHEGAWRTFDEPGGTAFQLWCKPAKAAL